MGRISLCNMEHIDMQLFLSSSPTVTSMCFDAFRETPKCNSSFIRYLYIYIYIYIYVCVCVCVYSLQIQHFPKESKYPAQFVASCLAHCGIVWIDNIVVILCCVQGIVLGSLMKSPKLVGPSSP